MFSFSVFIIEIVTNTICGAIFVFYADLAAFCSFRLLFGDWGTFTFTLPSLERVFARWDACAKPWRSTAPMLVPWRLVLGAVPDWVRHSDLYSGLAGGIYLG